MVVEVNDVEMVDVEGGAKNGAVADPAAEAKKDPDLLTVEGKKVIS